MIQRFGKRCFDLILVIPLITLFIPVMILISLLLWIRLGPPVIFKQTRPGLRGRPFILYKLRTMNNQKGKDGKLLPDRDRLTGLGRILRSTSLDELPELFNVLMGDMSLVGPRPLLMKYLDRYSPEQARRHEVKPGITGWAQIRGRNAISWPDKFNLDIWYVNHQSLWLDFKILLITIGKVIKREGINQSDQTTMEEFSGN